MGTVTPVEREPIASITCPRCLLTIGITDTYLLEEQFEWIVRECSREDVAAHCDDALAVRAVLLENGRGICQSMRLAVLQWLFKSSSPRRRCT
jgi:hypothetical protein